MCFYSKQEVGAKAHLDEKQKKSEAKPAKRLFVTAIVVCVLLCACLLFLLLFKYVPAKYQPAAPPEPNAPVPEFITNDLMATIYNKSQLDEVFEVVIPQKEISELIANEELTGCAWPVVLNNVSISAPVIIFEPNTLSAMATIDYSGVPVVMTVVATPAIGDDGLLYLNIEKVKAGAINITGLATMLARAIFAHQKEQFSDDPSLAALAAACLDNEPFEPVFIVFDKPIRIINRKLENRKLTLVCKPEPPRP
jgi:hypothetical protein